MPFEDALAARLSILQLTRAQLSAFLHERTLPLVPGVQALIQALQARGVAVHCISGGFTDVRACYSHRLEFTQPHLTPPLRARAHTHRSFYRLSLI